MCGRLFAPDDMLQFDRTWVCAGCKTLFVQKLRVGGRVGCHGLWRSNRTLVMLRDAELPPRCVKCNALTTDQMPRTFYWHFRLCYLLILVHVLVYLIVALIVRKRPDIRIAVCPRHRSRQRWAIATAWFTGLCGIGAFVQP